MINYIIIALVVAAVVVAAIRTYQSAVGTRDCCSGARIESGTSEDVHVHVADTDPSHYPYEADFRVSGMHCVHCAANVERALNGVGGIWATVDLEHATAHVLSKQPIDTAVLEAAVSRAGYRLKALPGE